MKKTITLLWCLMYSYGISLCASSLFSIGVPQELFDQKSSLIIYMVDLAGNQHVGKCQLDQNNRCRKISQNELEMTTFEAVHNLDTAFDLTASQNDMENVVVLHFEFDNSVRVLQVLVVKETLLEDNPFDVLTLSLANADFESKHHEFEDDPDLDALETFAQNIGNEQIKKSMKENYSKASLFEQYVLYAKIYMMMQYGYVKRTMSSWFMN